jgi:release factor glutamine methyltransferase
VNTVKDILLRTAAFLAEHGADQPRLEAELLLAHALEMGRLDLYMAFDRPLDDGELTALRPLVRRRANREPLYWVLGTKGFHDIELLCHRDVLVPRADTEALVEAALARLPLDAEAFVADVGCGTGAVGLAIAAARPNVKVYAIDLADAAIANTRANVAALGLENRVAVLQGDLLRAVPPQRPIDIIVSNPPYIATDVLTGLSPEVRDHEPRLALDGGRDGLDIYRSLVPAAAQRARIGVLVEIGHDQSEPVASLFRRSLDGVHVLPDLGGRPRVVLGHRAGVPWPQEPEVKSLPTGESVVELEVPQVAAPLDPDGKPLPTFDADR